MTDHKKKGDFDQWQEKDKGGNKKAHEHAENSRRPPAPAATKAETAHENSPGILQPRALPLHLKGP